MHSKLKFSLRTLLGICLTLGMVPAAFGANKFIVVKDEREIPFDKFIYIIVNIKSGQRLMGYSKSDLEFNDVGKIVGGVRNGGHAMLLMTAMGVEDFDRAAFEKVKPKVGEGEWVGGGFIKSSLGVTMLHVAMSNKGAGKLNDSLDSKGIDAAAMNPLLPIVNNAWKALVPLEYAHDLYRGIAEATGQYLWIDYNMLESPHFIFNAGKHKDVKDYFARIARGSTWMPQVVKDINDARFPDGVRINREKFSKLLAEKDAAVCSNLKWKTQFIQEQVAAARERAFEQIGQ